MKKRTAPYSKFLLVMLFLSASRLIAQIAPFDLSPQWYFGNRAGMDFNSGTPSVLLGGMTDAWTTQSTIEAATTICDQSGKAVFYSDGYRLYDQNNNVISFLNGGTSSTQTAVSVPDPANPTQRFYLFTANVDDNGGGDKGPTANLGISWYHIAISGSSISIIGGPVQIAAHDQVTEQLCAGTDDNGNYWIVAHEGGNYDWKNWGILAWPVTASGVGSMVRTSLSTVVPWNVYTVGNNVWHGSMKINTCQNRLAAVYGTGDVEIFNWDNKTGTVTSLIRRLTAYPALYGCEFSPDGNILYFTSLANNKLYQLDIASGSVYTDATWVSVNNANEMGTLQLGPDKKIYVTNGSNGADPGGTPCYIGVVDNPDVYGAGCNYVRTGFLLNNGPGIYPNIDKGISNLAWINPNDPAIKYNCSNSKFSYNFNTYFNRNISILASSEQWDFGEGAGFQSGFGATPTHTYGIDGSYTVRIKVTDSYCNKTWTGSKTITSSCSLPVIWNSLNIGKTNDQTVKINWSTKEEFNSHFFVIERSKDGTTFEAIGKVDPTLIENNDYNYEYYDVKGECGISYYRIKQVDYDNQVFLSNIVSIQLSKELWNIYPNPSNKGFTITSNEETDSKVSIFDCLGKELYTLDFSSFIAFGEDLPKGTYFAKVTLKDNIKTVKLIKE